MKSWAAAKRATVRVPSQSPFVPSVAPVTSVANDKGDNEVMIPGPVDRSPGICLTAEENPGKPQLGDRLMKGQCSQSSLWMVNPQPSCICIHTCGMQVWREKASYSYVCAMHVVSGNTSPSCRINIVHSARLARWNPMFATSGTLHPCNLKI